MKKIYFLISIFIFGLTSGLITNSVPSGIKNNNFTANNINIANDKYLSLAYQNGKFFSWNQSNNQSDNYIVGIFTSEDNISYLLSNTGVFTNLRYQVVKLTRINDTKAIAQLSYYYDNKGHIWSNKNFLVAINVINGNNNFVILNDEPIASINNNFVILNDTTFIAYGFGLDLITLNGDIATVTNKIPPYQGGYSLTTFYKLSITTGIFINSDRQLYYLTNINSSFNKTALNIYTLTNFANNVAVLDSDHFIFRDYNNDLYYYDLNNMKFNSLNFKSFTKNFCFNLKNNQFVINTATKNSSDTFGVPYLITITNPSKPITIPIDGKNSLTNMVFNTDSTGIFIDGSSFAYHFQFLQNQDKFTFTNIGNINQYQFINQDLGFITFQNTNLLFSWKGNQDWLLQKSISFSVVNNNTTVNFLNNLIPKTPTELINDQNSYFANNALTLTVNNADLQGATAIIIPSQGTTSNLKPINNVINYLFNNFISYQVSISFLVNGTSYNFKYQVIINSFNQEKLLNVFAPNITNYVGINSNQLYDIQAINDNDYFTLTAFNYHFLQNVQLIRYDDANLIIRSITNLKQGDRISSTVDIPVLKEYLCALRVEDLLGQTRMIYLGFVKTDKTKPMMPFWDSNQGKNLRKAALLRDYSNKQLDNMDVAAINTLIKLAKTWNLIKAQATTLAYIIVSATSVSTIIALFSIAYNFYLEKLIKSKKLTKRKQNNYRKQ